MAGQPDGSIIIDTELDSQGFDAGSRRLEAAVRSLVSKVNSLGPSFQRALGGSEGAVASFQSRAAALRDQIAEMQQQLEQMGATQYQTTEYTQLNAELEKTDQTINRLIDKQERMEALGVDKQSAQWRGLQYDLDQAISKYNELLAQKQEMEASGGAYQMGAQTEEYAQLTASLSLAQQQLAEMQGRVEEANAGLGSGESHLSGMATAARAVVSALVRATRTVVGGLVSALRAGASHMARLFTHSRSARSQFSGLISGAKKFALSLLGARGVFALLRKAVSAYMQQNQELASTLSSCWSGIGNILGPIISRLINMVATAVSYVTSFLKLFGVFGKGASKAIGAAGGAASSAAKDLKRQLASFDELNILNDNGSDSGGGGGGGAGGASGLSDVEMPDWVKLMVDQLKAGNWAAAATTLTTQLNSMVDSVDWKGLGGKIGYGLNGALTFLATFIRTFDWFNLGANLAEGVNEILRSVDWGNLGTILSAKFRIIIQTAAGFLLNLDWSALAQGFSDFAINFLNGITEAVASVDWQQLGRDVAQFLREVDWNGIFDALCEAIGAVVGGIIAFFKGLLEDAWGEVIDWWHEVAYEDGKFTIEGLLNGIGDALASIGTWIYEHIFKPFIDGFKSVFGIASPSTVMEEQGDFIIQGLLNGITGAWSGITGFFGQALSTVGSAIGGAWSGIKTVTANTWSNIKSGLSSTWENVKSKASSTWDGLKSSVGTGWDNIKSLTANTWDGVKRTLSNTWDTVKANLSSAMDRMKSTATSTWNNVKTVTSDTWSSIKSKLSSTWDNIKSTAASTWASIKNSIQNQGWSGVGSNICSGISNGLTEGWKWLKDKVGNLARSLVDKAKDVLKIGSPSKVFEDEVGVHIDSGLGRGLDKGKPRLLSVVSGIADAVAGEFKSGTYTIPMAKVDGTMAGFSDRIVNSFDALLLRLQQIADRVTFVVPAPALGAMVPYSVAAMVDGRGGSGDLYSLLEDIDDDLAGVIASAVSSATVAVVEAIREAGNRPVRIDKRALTDSVREDIDRRTKMFGYVPT